MSETWKMTIDYGNAPLIQQMNNLLTISWYETNRQTDRGISLVGGGTDPDLDMGWVHSCAAALGRPLPTSLRRRFSAASQVRQSTTPGPSATPAANVRPTGFLCGWPVGLELIARQFERFEC